MHIIHKPAKLTSRETFFPYLLLYIGKETDKIKQKKKSMNRHVFGGMVWL